MGNHVEFPDELMGAQSSLLASLEGFDFFQESYRKQVRLRAVAAASKGGNFRRILVVDDPVNLGNVASAVSGLEVIKKEINWFQSLSSPENGELLEGSVVLFTNNNVAGIQHEAFVEMISRFPNNLYVVWDFDNHHWLQNSGRVAMSADIYVPAHYDNLFLISRFNSFCLEPVNCGVVQWNSEFLIENLPGILCRQRNPEPLGRHTPWNFPYRLKVLQTFSEKLPSVGVCSPDFNLRTPLERLDEWCSHKSHVVIPVYNDLPIRIFDALITGGIPILPRSLQIWAGLGGIGLEDAVFYDATDIVEPEALVRKANALFDSSGRLGMMRRIQKALTQFHCDARVAAIVDRARDLIKTVA